MPDRSQTAPVASPSSQSREPALPSKQATLPAVPASLLPSPSSLEPTSPSRPHAPARPSPLTRASNLWQQHAPAQLHDLHFRPLPQMSLPQLPQFDLAGGLMGMGGFLSRFAAPPDDNDIPAPEVVGSGYEPLGDFKDLFGFHCYVVGPDPSLDCCVCATDIFGFSLQSIQGADHVHHLTGSTVYMPDLFRGRPFPSQAFPPKGEDEIAQLNHFFSTRANIDDRRDEIVEFGRALRTRFTGGDWENDVHVSAYGLSWGGKLMFLAASSTLPFYAVAAVSPAMLTLPDAEALKIPVALFASVDEPDDVVLQIIETFRRKTFSARCVCRTWPDQRHGWAGARGDLTKPEVLKAFGELYTSLSAFLRSAKRAEMAPSPPAAPNLEDRVDMVLERVGIGRGSVREGKKDRKAREKREKGEEKAKRRLEKGQMPSSGPTL